MAYRTADQERWKDFDFVVGQRVCLSPTNHPVADICDELKGEYPKDFKFVGWHPHCRCYVESILKSDKELKEDTRRIINGEPPTDSAASTNAVTDTPPNFDAWVKDNRQRIEHAKTPPYFIRDNRTRIDDILGGKGKAQPDAKHFKTPQQAAAERHEARTPEAIATLSEVLRRHGTLEGAADIDERTVMKLWWELNDEQRLRVLRDGQFTGMIMEESDLSFASLYRPTAKQNMVGILQDELENAQMGRDVEDTNHYVIKLKGKAPMFSEELTKPLTKSQINNIEWISANEGLSNYRYWTANADCVADMRKRMGFVEYEDGVIIKSHNLRETPKIEIGLKTARKSLIRQNREVMMIIGKNGKPIKSISGATRSVYFDEETAALAKNNVVTHNHPTGKNATGAQAFGYSLSLDDLLEAFKCDMRGMVAESPMYRYAIERPNNGWNIDAKQFRVDYEKNRNDIITNYADILERHRADNIVQHLVLKRLSKQYGFVYLYTRL